MNISQYSNITETIVPQPFVAVFTRNGLLVVLYVSINYINGTLVHTFFKHDIFRENPRYILFICMVINDMIQLTISVSLHLIFYIFFQINISFCCLLLFIAALSTQITPLSLASMAMERFIAVSFPLRHTQICTVFRTYLLIGLICFLSSVTILPELIFLIATEAPAFFYSSLPCTRYNVFKNPYLTQLKNILFQFYLSVVWICLVFSYFRIMFAARAASSQVKKACNTIILHGIQLLLCMLTYIWPPLETLFCSLFPTFTFEIRFTSFLIVQVFPRFLSPIIYGLRDKMLLMYLKRYLICKKTNRTKEQTS